MKNTHLCMIISQERSITALNLSAACSMSPLDMMQHVISPFKVIFLQLYGEKVCYNSCAQCAPLWYIVSMWKWA